MSVHLTVANVENGENIETGEPVEGN